jgi:hypothetical protein
VSRSAPGSHLPRQNHPRPYQPIWPELELVSERAAAATGGARASAPADPAFTALGARMAPDLLATQKADAGGFRLLVPAAL